MNKNNKQLLEELKMVKHKIGWEGFDYCFIEYSSWNSVVDEEFHKLRKGYISGKVRISELQNYIDVKIISLEKLSE